MENSLLFIRGFIQALLRCIAGDEAAKVFQEVHVEKCENIKGAQGYSNRFCILVIIGRIWRLILSFAGRCQSCQLHIQELCKQYGVHHVKSSPYYS